MNEGAAAYGLGVPAASAWAREATLSASFREWLRANGIDVEALEAEAAAIAAEPGQPGSREAWFRALAEVRGHPQRDGLLKAVRQYASLGQDPHEIACHLKAMLAVTIKPPREKRQHDIPVYPETIERMRLRAEGAPA